MGIFFYSGTEWIYLIIKIRILFVENIWTSITIMMRFVFSAEEEFRFGIFYFSILLARMLTVITQHVDQKTSKELIDWFEKTRPQINNICQAFYANKLSVKIVIEIVSIIDLISLTYDNIVTWFVTIPKSSRTVWFEMNTRTFKLNWNDINEENRNLPINDNRSISLWWLDKRTTNESVSPF